MKKLLNTRHKISIFHQAIVIAQRELKACITSEGFAAGSHHFVDLWARDSLFATFGANAAGLSSVSKKTIEIFLRYQREDGLIPYLILRGRHSIGKYFGKYSFYTTPKPVFRSHLSFGTVPDGGVLTIIAMRKYIETTGDVSFLKKQYETLKKAFLWYEKKFGNGLISEWFSCEWTDAVLKIGNTLYTNVLYYKAADDLFWIAHRLKKVNDATRYAKVATRIADQIRSHFWTGLYFADWVDWRRQDYFASHSNMLAIVFGVANTKQTKSIFKYAQLHCWNGWTLVSNWPGYPWWRIPFLHAVIGMSDYHNGMVWLQPGLMYTVALYRIGNIKVAKRILRRIAKKIVVDKGVYEVYEKNNTPLKRFLYRAEQPFAWSAGLFLFAKETIMNNSRRNETGYRKAHKPA